MDEHREVSGWAEEVLCAIGAGVIVMARSGEILFANPRSRTVLRRSEDALVGSNVSEALLAIDQLASCPPNERLGFDVELPGGDIISVGANIVALANSPGDPAYVCMFQDITKLRQLQSERDRLLQIGALNSVLPAMLHELRNPVAAIATSLEVLVEEAEGSLQGDLHALLGEIRRVSLNLQGVGSVGRDLRSTRFAAVDESLHNLIRVMETRAKRNEILLVNDIGKLPPLPFDLGVIQSIVFNLLHNAIAASKLGGTVSISATLDQQAALHLVVTDHGVGMSSEVIEQATSLFFTTKPRGSGIGLALVKMCVEGAGGILAFNSKENIGTEVTILIPAATSPPGKISSLV